jgi:hypothetical protein
LRDRVMRMTGVADLSNVPASVMNAAAPGARS